MKTFTTLLFISCWLSSLAQENAITLEGKIVNQKGQPIADVYIINPRTLEKDITLSNGIFTVKVLPSDSLFFSHIAYFRKSMRMSELQTNSTVVLEAEHVEIQEIRVSPNQLSDIDRAQKNLSFLNDYKVIQYKRMEPDPDPLDAALTEHNRAMRTEAASINLLPILAMPVNMVDKAIKKRKHRKRFSSYSSTRKQKVLVDESSNTANGGN